MFDKTFRKQKANAPIQARTINQFIGPISGLMRMRVGSGLSSATINGIPLHRASPGPFAKCVVTDSSGITAFNATTKVLGKGTCRVWDVDIQNEKLVDTGLDITVYNMIAATVGGSKDCQVKWIDGLPFIDVEAC